MSWRTLGLRLVFLLMLWCTTLWELFIMTLIGLVIGVHGRSERKGGAALPLIPPHHEIKAGEFMGLRRRWLAHPTEEETDKNWNAVQIDSKGWVTLAWDIELDHFKSMQPIFEKYIFTFLTGQMQYSLSRFATRCFPSPCTGRGRRIQHRKGRETKQQTGTCRFKRSFKRSYFLRSANRKVTGNFWNKRLGKKVKLFLNARF